MLLISKVARKRCVKCFEIVSVGVEEYLSRCRMSGRADFRLYGVHMNRKSFLLHTRKMASVQLKIEFFSKLGLDYKKVFLT